MSTAIVLSGGGARGAYEAGVLSYLFERIYPQLPPAFEFDIVSGTSVGAIHAGYTAASADLDPVSRAQALTEIWTGMTLDHVLHLSASDWIGVPMRMLGMGSILRREQHGSEPDVLGGLVDIAPLERLVEERIPWRLLRANLDRGRPQTLCVACTNVHTGLVTVFLDGGTLDISPWETDPYAQAIRTQITSHHVRASAAIPFLFPAVRIGDSYYLDGGLRANTPLSPPLRLGADKLLVIALKATPVGPKVIAQAEQAIAQPAFVLGKMLNVLILDQLEQELRRVETINTLLRAADEAAGHACRDAICEAVRASRGVEYRPVEMAVVRPSEDLGAIAADAYHNRRTRSHSQGLMHRMFARSAMRGAPENEADLLSYLYFDASYTEPLVELGRSDARKAEDEILELFGGNGVPRLTDPTS